MGYRDQLSFVESLDIPDGHHHRGDCPFCNGQNTFSASKADGTLQWFCFKASCKVSGTKTIGYTLGDIRRKLHKEESSEHPSFQLPDYLTSPLSDPECVAFLQRTNSLPAYSSRLADIRYDPRAHRAVFVGRLHGNIVGASGRALHKDTKPKWWRYDSNQYPFVVGKHSTALIVEDAASACAVSHCVTGIALLGTNFSGTYLSFVRGYKKVWIALDNDATRKAVDIQRAMSYFADVSVLYLDDDLKYLNQSDLREYLRAEGVDI